MDYLHIVLTKVRQCVRDLSDEFGFLIGKWNQSYQFDICPKSIAFEELRPGDLIFYEGKYNSNRLYEY